MICFSVWVLFVGAIFYCSKRHNEKCSYELLKVKWEPWVLSSVTGVLVLAVLIW